MTPTTPATPAAAAATTRRRHPPAPAAVALMPFLLLLALAHAAPAQTTQPYRPTLFAFGAADRYWVANVESYKADGKTLFKTLVRGQALPGGEWHDLGTLQGQAAGIAQSQGDLAVLMDDDSWKRLGAAGLSTGTDLPGAGRVLAWGSVGPTLYAVRAVNGGRDSLIPKRAGDSPSPTTTPASRLSAATAASAPAATRPAPSTVSTVPATAATRPPPVPVLLKMDKGDWIAVADLPAAAQAAATFSIAGPPGKPLLAAAADAGPIRVWALNDGRWESFGDRAPPAHPVTFGLVVAGSLPALWTLDAAGNANLHVRHEGEDWSKAIPLTTPGGAALPSAQRALAAAGEDFRLVLLNDGKFLEQRYDSAGAPRGNLIEMPAPQVNRPDPYTRLFQLFLLIALVVAVLVTFYKRRKDSGAPQGGAGENRRGE